MIFTNYQGQSPDTASLFGGTGNSLPDGSLPHFPLGERHQVVRTLSDYTVRLLNLLQSIDFPEALGGELLNRRLQEGRAAIMPVPTHTKSPSALSLRTPERESLGIWHPKYLCSRLSRQEDQIPKAKTAVYFLIAARRYSASSWMVSVVFLPRCLWLPTL